MATFPGLPLPYLGPILMHAGIPAYCLGDYFRLLLVAAAESTRAWTRKASWPGRQRPAVSSRLSQLDKPAQRFLLNGGDYAHDIVDRTLDLLDRLTEPDPDFDARPAARLHDRGRQRGTRGRAPRPVRGGSARPAAGRRGGRRQAQPQIALDPYGQGVHVLLPAVGDTPDGVARWRITADGETRTVQSRAMWVGAAETTPQTAFPLDRPVRTVLVSLAGHEDLPPSSASSTRPTPSSSSTRTAAGWPTPCRCPGARSGSCTRPTGSLSSPGSQARSSSLRSPSAGTAGGCASSRWRTCRPSACRAAARIR